jgi:acetate kinase
MDSISVNTGCSSVKFQLFALDGAAQLTRKIKGQIEGIGTRPRFPASGPDRRALIDREYDPPTIADMPAAMRSARGWLREEERIAPSAVGHRVVHGGSEYGSPVPINKQALARLERYVPLAPLHLAHDRAPICAILAGLPELAQVCLLLRYGLSSKLQRGCGSLEGLAWAERELAASQQALYRRARSNGRRASGSTGRNGDGIAKR